MLTINQEISQSIQSHPAAVPSTYEPSTALPRVDPAPLLELSWNIVLRGGVSYRMDDAGDDLMMIGCKKKEQGTRLTSNCTTRCRHEKYGVQLM